MIDVTQGRMCKQWVNRMRKWWVHTNGNWTHAILMHAIQVLHRILLIRICNGVDVDRSRSATLNESESWVAARIDLPGKRDSE